MELTKRDTQAAKGIAIIGMIMLHLFCRRENLPYTPILWIGDVPFIYYLGLFGDYCVPVYCFCSGYAHYLLCEKNAGQYRRGIPVRLLRFLLNYWIVLILFSVLGVFFDDTGMIPGSTKAFLGNFCLYGLSYNGTWWFVLTYVFLLVLSPVIVRIVKRLSWVKMLALCFAVYLLAYVFRVKTVLNIPNPVLNWIVSQTALLGTSQFGYILGMIFYKQNIIGKMRPFLRQRRPAYLAVVAILPMLAFAGHCVVQSMIVAPFTALAVLLSIFAMERPKWFDGFLVFMGRHSKNIWLVHMFFYLVLFKDLVFCAKYPILIVSLMFVICIGVSKVIGAVYQPLCHAAIGWYNKLIKQKSFDLR